MDTLEALIERTKTTAQLPVVYPWSLNIGEKMNARPPRFAHRVKFCHD